VALTDIELLAACVGFTLQHTHEAEQQTFKELETSGATRLVNALRVFRLQRVLRRIGGGLRCANPPYELISAIILYLTGAYPA